MTAIGAMPEGVDETEIARRVAEADPDTLRRWAADVRQWVVGPYTGATPVDELRLRAAVLIDTLSGGRKASTVAGGVTVTETPTPGPEGLPTTDTPSTDGATDGATDTTS